MATIVCQENRPHVIPKHDNFTFARAVQKYAKEHQWEGFDIGVGAYIAEGEALKDFGGYYFDMCQTAIHNLGGVAAMQIADEGEITRLAINYGIHENMIGNYSVLPGRTPSVWLTASQHSGGLPARSTGVCRPVLAENAPQERFPGAQAL